MNVLKKIISLNLQALSTFDHIQKLLNEQLPKIELRSSIETHQVRMLERSIKEAGHWPRTHRPHKKSNFSATLGVGGFSAIDIAIYNDADVMILADINPEQIDQWREMKAAIKNAHNLDEFIENYAKAIVSKNIGVAPFQLSSFNATRLFRHSQTVHDDVKVFLQRHYEFNQDIHLCFEPGNFDKLKQLFLNSILIQIDITDPDSSQKIVQVLEENNILIEGVYLSNIPYFCRSETSDFSQLGLTGRLAKLKDSINALCKIEDAVIFAAIEKTRQFNTEFFSKEKLFDKFDALLKILT